MAPIARSIVFEVFAACILTLAARAQVETIGPWPIRAAPVSASQISGGGSFWLPLNVTNTPIGVNEAFSGVSVIDDGYANANQGTVLEVVFAAGVVSNGTGDDLVMFDARFSSNSYSIATDYDGFTAQLALPDTAFAATGVTGHYYYNGNGPLAVAVHAATLDLTSVGVPSGTSITTVRITCTSSQADPLGIGALCNPGCAVMSTYCTPGTTVHGCVASITAAGVPSASIGLGFTISVANVEGGKQGLIFYGVSGSNASPWGVGGTSWLCVKAPTQRMSIQSSGGTSGLCDGALQTDWNAFIATNPTALGNPFAVGAMVNAQGWFRDPGSVKNTSLSDALQFTVGP